MRVTRWILTTLALLVATPALAQTPAQPPFRPELKSAVRAGIGVAGDMRADDGFGLQVDYDIPVTAEAGPGRLLLGPSGMIAFASESHRNGPSGCDFDDSETIVALLGSMRYVFDIHQRLRPWGRLGLGLHVVDFERDASGCPFEDDFDRNDDDIGPGALIGFGLDIDVSSNTLVSVGADLHQGEDDFASLTVLFGWRF